MVAEARSSGLVSPGRTVGVFLLLAALTKASTIIHYEILEEREKGFPVGNVVTDLGLDLGSLSARRLRVVSGASRRFFEVNWETGEMFVNDRLDREELCGTLPSCTVTLELVVENPLELFSAEVVVQDINDNNPSFPTGEMKLEISEAMAPGTRFPLESAHDPDVGSNSLQTYELSHNEYFALRVQTREDGTKYAELVLERALDWEREPNVQLVLTAVDGGTPARSASLPIRITVLDANDNAPSFNQSLYRARVREDAPPGTRVTQVRATDLDEGLNGEIVYSFGSHNRAGVRELFALDLVTGVLTIKGRLDFEDTKLHEIYIQAKDKGANPEGAHCKVLVEVVDVNDNAPEITVTSVYSPVPEDAPLGTVIALLSVTDLDAGENGLVTCEVPPGLPFSLTSSLKNYFTLKTSAVLDRETMPEYNLSITARDSGTPSLSALTTVRVQVSDINDNPPQSSQSSYDVYVEENNPPGVPILNLSVWDPDAPHNARLSFFLLEPGAETGLVGRYFTINRDNGVLTTLVPLDYEGQREFQLTAHVNDGGTPVLATNISVNIFVTDRNDNAPQVLYPRPGQSSVEMLPRGTAAGHVVSRVVGWDADAGHNAWLSYSLLGASNQSLFTVGLHTGQISTARPVQDTDSPRQILTVLISDNGEPLLSTTATLTVSVTEESPEARAEFPSVVPRLRGSVMEENLRFASSGDDIRIWDASSMILVDKFNPHTSPHGISSICWSSNNNFLVTASSSGDKIVVSSCKCKPVPLLELAEGQKQTCVDLNSTSMYLASGGLNNTVNIWDLKSKRVHRSLKDHKAEVTCVAYNWNDCYIASGSLSGEIVLHSITTNTSSTPFGHGSNQPVRHVKYSLFKKSLLGSVSDNGVVTLWDVNSQSSYHSFDSTHKAPASGICFSPVNELLFVTIGLDKRIILYDTSSKKLVKTLVADTPLTAVDFMPDGATLAIGSSRGKIYQYDLRMLKSPVKTISAHKTSVQCIAFQYSTTLTKASLNKGCSNKGTSVNKRSVAVSSSSGAAQNSGPVREATAPSIATVLPQPVTSSVVRGAAAAQDKAGLSSRSINTDILSKETDGGKSQDFSSFDDTRKSSLGDMFSPVRDDVVVTKGGDESVGKGDGLDFLVQLNSVFPPRKNPVASSPLVSHSSPLAVLMESPGKEDSESPDLAAEAKRAFLGKQEPKDSLKQFAKLISSGAEPGFLNTSPSSNQIRNLEKYEKPEKETEAPLIHEPSVNGSSTPVPKVASSVTAGVASSLSEKIVDTLGSSRTSAPLTSVQIRFIQNMIQETLDDCREACHKDIVNLQVEMIKQFHIQLNEIHSLLERYSVNEGLVAEVERLREENKRLRTHF